MSGLVKIKIILK